MPSVRSDRRPTVFVVFGGLDDIDWRSMKHAYGSAGDVPRMLADWVGPDPDASRLAVADLWSCLFHQGDLHPTAAVAGPFFVEALRTGPDHVFADAYFFLDHMVAPGSPMWEADGFVAAAHESPPSYWSAAAALDVFLECTAPGRANGLATLMDPRFIGRQVAQTLWWFPHAAAEIAATLRSRLLASDDHAERVPLLLCLAVQGRHMGTPIDLPVFTAAAASPDAGERLAGIIALARTRELHTEGAEFKALRSALDSPIELGYPIDEPRGTLPLGEQLVSDALLASVIPNPPATDPLTPLQYDVSEMVADRAAENVEDLLEFYGI